MSKKFWTYYSGPLECFYCVGPVFREFPQDHPMRATVDHLTPVSRGGSNSLFNLVLACRSCNNRKGNRVEAKVPENRRCLVEFYPSLLKDQKLMQNEIDLLNGIVRTKLKCKRPVVPKKAKSCLPTMVSKVCWVKFEIGRAIYLKNDVGIKPSLLEQRNENRSVAEESDPDFKTDSAEIFEQRRGLNFGL